MLFVGGFGRWNGCAETNRRDQLYNSARGFGLQNKDYRAMWGAGRRAVKRSQAAPVALALALALSLAALVATKARVTMLPHRPSPVALALGGGGGASLACSLSANNSLLVPSIWLKAAAKSCSTPFYLPHAHPTHLNYSAQRRRRLAISCHLARLLASALVRARPSPPNRGLLHKTHHPTPLAAPVDGAGAVAKENSGAGAKELTNRAGA